MDARTHRDEALDLLEQLRAEYVEEARNAAIRLAWERGQITIDDVREVCPPPPEIDPRVMGAVMRRDFEKVGYAQSRRRECHARPIAVFRLREAA